MRQWLAAVAVALAALTGTAMAIHADDPYLVPLRPWIEPGLLVVALLVVVALWWRGAAHFGRTGRRIIILLWLAVPVAVLVMGATGAMRRQRMLAMPPELAQRLGAHVILGYGHRSEIEPLVSRGLIGGIFITRRNVVGRSAADVRAEIGDLQTMRRSAGLPPLIVAADQEGGMVSRLSPPLAQRPPLAELAALPAGLREIAAFEQGKATGAELLDLGVTLDFAPVVDLRTDRPADAFDFHSQIARRAIAADAPTVIAVASAFASGLASAGVAATLKHFPGLGRVEEDTHHFRAGIKASVAELEATDWRPFRAILAQSPSVALMAGHASVEALAPGVPASQSRALIEGVIRRQWGFDGLVVSDDVLMNPVFRADFCSGVVAGLNAGVDLLLMAYDNRPFARMFECLLEAERRGAIDGEMLARSRGRLRRR